VDVTLTADDNAARRHRHVYDLDDAGNVTYTGP